MDFTNVKSLVIPEGTVTAIHTNAVLMWQSGASEPDVPKFTNQVPLSTESDGVTIYNSGLGYKTGYRLRSGGAEATQTGGTITGYIPVNAGDVVRIFDISDVVIDGTGTGINVYDSSYTHIGQAASNGAYGIFVNAYNEYSWGNSGINEGNGVFRWTVPPAESGVAFIRVSVRANSTTALGSNLIVTVNEEITE